MSQVPTLTIFLQYGLTIFSVLILTFFLQYGLTVFSVLTFILSVLGFKYFLKY